MKKKMSLGRLIVTIFTVMLTFTLILILFVGVGTVRDVISAPDYYSEDTYLYALQSRDYSYLLGITRRDAHLDKEYSHDVLESRAVAGYFEAATLYKAYMEAENMEQAENQKKKMDNYVEQMGQFQMHKSYIDEMLGVSSPKQGE